MALRIQERCLYCDYSLEGLPRPYRCPECAKPYDNDTVIYRPSRTWVLYLTVSGVWLLGSHMAQSCITPIVLSTGTSRSGLALVAAIVLSYAYSMYRVWRSNRRGRFIALTESGVVLRTHVHELESIPYRDITLVSVVDWSPWIKRRGNDHEIHLNRLFDGAAERKEFKRRITARIEAAGRPTAMAVDAECALSEPPRPRGV